MARTYFRHVPEFDYVNRLPNAKNGDYIRTKNLFKRARIRPDIFNNLFYFTRFQIRPGDRPDDVSQEVYDTPNYDWVVLLGNNIINPGSEWPLDQQSFDNYLMNKYGSEENINATNHHETIEVKNSLNKIVIPAGLTVPKNFTLDYYDSGLGSEVTASQITVEVTNYQEEERLQNESRNIYILKPFYLMLIEDDLDAIMPYKKGSSQYVSPSVVRGDDIRLYT
jgi:hypothetical protein